ncbi:MAG: HAD family hydrolase [Methanomicrobiales archaeon]|nr:HAD family hydrolase [Methanomicrobiales archaeon]
MTIAVVFDSAGTLLRTYRIVKDIVHEILLHNIETTMLTSSSRERVLVVLHTHSRDIIAADPDMLLSRYLTENNIGFGIACAGRVITAGEVGDLLYADTYARMRDLQECTREVWAHCRQESTVVMNSGAILNFRLGGVEFAVTTGGRPFDGAKDTITELHRRGIATYIASGDRGVKLEKIADYLGIPANHVYGIATPSIKAQIVRDLKRDYTTVVMVGDGVNDIPALREADVAILSLQQGGEKPPELFEAADYTIRTVTEVCGIVGKIGEQEFQNPV